jgi:lysophospholipase L1-like esterase
LVIVQLGANDLNTNVDVATYSANLLDIVTKAKATGADVVLENPANGNTGGYGSDALRQSYRQAQIALCAVQGCIVVDHAAAFGSWAQANANGLMYDAIHGLEPRYAAEAARLVQATAP